MQANLTKSPPLPDIVPAPGAPSPDTVSPPKEFFRQATVLAGEADWAGLQALLAETPDTSIEPRAWTLLIQLGRALPDPSAIERAVTLATRPDQPASPRVLLIMHLMDDRDGAASAAAWRIFNADPGLVESKSAPNALRCLAKLHPRLPQGSARELAGELLSRFRDGFPDADELLDIERREKLPLLTAEQDWDGICQLAATTPDHHIEGDVALAFLTAALHLRRRATVKRLLTLMARDLVRPPRRIWIARRLAEAGLPHEAVELLEEPGLLTSDAEIRLAMVAILRILRRQGWQGDLQARGTALVTQLEAPALPPPLTRPFPTTPGFHRSPHIAPLLLVAPGVSAAEEAVFARLVAASQDSMTRPDPAQHIHRPKVLTYEDVAVSDTGRIWDAAGRVAPILHRSTLRDLPVLPPDADFFAEAAVATDIPPNFFHWLAEGFPALAWRLHPSAPPLPVLINERAEPLMRETLSLLGDPLPLVTVRQPVRVGRAHVARRGFEPLLYWECYGPLYERLVQAALRQPPPAESGTRIYLSRRDAPHRSLANEAAVEEALAALGFTIVTFIGRPLAQQIQLIQQAEIVVAPHGAGLAHLAHARGGLKVFEFMPVATGTEALRCCFMHLSAARGHRHALWLETAQQRQPPWHIHLDAMLPALRRFMEETSGR